MEKAPEVRVVVPAETVSGQGTKVFINGTEFGMLKRIEIGEAIETGGMNISTIQLTFYGDILVERGNG